MSQIKPFAVFDVDGTLFKSSLLEKVIKHSFEVGLFDRQDFLEAARLRREWQLHNSEQAYMEYINTLIGSFVNQIKGVDAHVFDWVTDKMVKDHQVRLFAFPRQLMEAVRQTHTLIIISGSPEIVVKPFVEQFNVDYVFGSIFEQNNGRYTGQAASVGDKASIIHKLIDDKKIALEGSLAIGDTVSDISMLELADRSIMFNPSLSLSQHGSPLGWHKVYEVKDNITALKLDHQHAVYQETAPQELMTPN